MRDPHRPVYHMLPAKNWMNDPNGLVQHAGVFHAFYQHNPFGPLWGNMSWGHARSTDLVHWEHMPIAIEPTFGGPDADGCFSGAIAVHNDIPTMIYTGVRGEDQLCCLAYPDDDDLTVWRKYEGNPVISAPPANLNTTIFRDHTLWRDGNTWLMGIGSGIEGTGGAVLLYQSTDFRNWQYLHPLAIEQPELNAGTQLISTGWECPDFFFLDEEPVLLACEWDGDPISSSWWRGEYLDRRFHATSKGVTDFGDCLYAPQTFQAEDGRRLFFGWLREIRSDVDQVAAGWSGVMSLPREVILLDDGTVGFQPAEEIRQLRQSEVHFQITSGLIPTAAACEIEILSGNEHLPPFRLCWEENLQITWTGSELHLRTQGRESYASISENQKPPGELRVFIDHSVVEVFLGTRIVMSTRVYRDASVWDQASFTADGTPPFDVAVFHMKSIW